MKRPPMPYKPEQPQPDQDDGLSDFMSDTDFLQKLHNPHYPHQGAGVHVPVWLSPKVARDVLAQHGQTGHAIPHPDLKLFRK